MSLRLNKLSKTIGLTGIIKIKKVILVRKILRKLMEIIIMDYQQKFLLMVKFKIKTIKINKILV
jgi:hypothetical protein